MNSGQRGGGDNQHSFNQFNHHNMMGSGNNMGNTPAPNQGNTPAPSGNTPAPNMMFGQNMQFGDMGMPNIGNMQAFQNQMMGSGMMGGGQNNQMMGVQPSMNMPMNNQAQSQPVKD